MRINGIGLSFLFVSLLSACGGGSGDSPPIDPDAQTLETTDGAASAGTTDTGTTDTGTTDTGTTDTGTTDTGTTDTGTTDTGTTDTGTTDTGTTDTGTTDTGTTDTGTTDTGTTDTGTAEYETPFGVAECSIDDIKSRVDFDMRDYYIYYDQVPTLNLGDYDSGNALIRDLRVDPDIYSSVRDEETQTALFEEGIQKGYGFGFQPSSDNVVRIRSVDMGSPADDAGILRGDEVVSVNGQFLSEFTNEDFDEIFGPDSTAAVSMTVRTGDNTPRTVSVSNEEFGVQSAAALNRYASNTDASLPIIGYLKITEFLVPTKDEIDSAFEWFEDEGGVDELIVDLRYNGGGRVSVANYLASVVGGAAVEGQVMQEFRFNDKYAEFNQSESFEKVDKPLNSPRVFVLTTEYTASASETFINSLKPYIDVVVIGTSTNGKPFGSIAQTHCDKSINAMSLLVVNAVGVSVLGGIQPDCVVNDSWNTVSQSVNDPLVNGALEYASTGTCVTDIVADAGGLRRKAPVGPTFRPKELVDFAIVDLPQH